MDNQENEGSQLSNRQQDSTVDNKNSLGAEGPKFSQSHAKDNSADVAGDVSQVLDGYDHYWGQVRGLFQIETRTICTFTALPYLLC